MILSKALPLSGLSLSQSLFCGRIFPCELCGKSILPHVPWRDPSTVKPIPPFVSQILLKTLNQTALRAPFQLQNAVVHPVITLRATPGTGLLCPPHSAKNFIIVWASVMLSATCSPQKRSVHSSSHVYLQSCSSISPLYLPHCSPFSE